MQGLRLAQDPPSSENELSSLSDCALIICVNEVLLLSLLSVSLLLVVVAVLSLLLLLLPLSSRSSISFGMMVRVVLVVLAGEGTDSRFSLIFSPVLLAGFFFAVAMIFLAVILLVACRDILSLSFGFALFWFLFFFVWPTGCCCRDFNFVRDVLDVFLHVDVSCGKIPIPVGFDVPFPLAFRAIPTRNSVEFYRNIFLMIELIMSFSISEQQTPLDLAAHPATLPCTPASFRTLALFSSARRIFRILEFFLCTVCG